MSIFDYFTGNASPEQSAGLIGLASGFNEALGDGRRPVNFGAALSAGARGMQQAQQGYADREREKQVLAAQAKLLGLKVQDAESDVANQQMLRDRAARIAARLQPQAGASSVLTPAAPGIAGPANQTDLHIQRMMAVAQAHADEGDVDGANKIYEQLVKLRPKFDSGITWVNGPDGKPVAVRTADDGSMKQIDGLAPREKAELVNLGGTSVAVNPFALTPGQQFQRTVSPDAALSASVSRENSMRTDARARDFNVISQEANAIKRGEKQREADLGKAGQVASFDTMLGTLDRLQTHPGLSRSTGLYSKVPTMPGSDSANFQAELETFKSQAFVPMVAQLKGMGALSDAEGRKLTAAVGALDPNMSEKAFRESIGRVVTEMTAARNRVVQSASPELQRSLSAGSQPAPAAAAAPRAPLKGQVVDGYRFKGGNPADPNNWERK